MLESQRHLAEISPSMSLVFMQSDIRRQFRELRAGEQQAGTAGFFARGLDRLADTLQPILSLLANIGNILGGSIVRVLDFLVKPLSAIAELLNWIIQKIPWLKRDEGDPVALGEWLGDVFKDAERGRRRVPAFR
jgi:hypothetical protein